MQVRHLSHCVILLCHPDSRPMDVCIIASIIQTFMPDTSKVVPRLHYSNRPMHSRMRRAVCESIVNSATGCSVHGHYNLQAADSIVSEPYSTPSTLCCTCVDAVERWTLSRCTANGSIIHNTV